MLCSKGIIKFFLTSMRLVSSSELLKFPNKQWDPNNGQHSNKGNFKFYWYISLTNQSAEGFDCNRLINDDRKVLNWWFGTQFGLYLISSNLCLFSQNGHKSTNQCKNLDFLFVILFEDYRIDFLWGQPIKLIQVVSTSEFHEYRWNDVDFNFFVPSIQCRASEVTT